MPDISLLAELADFYDVSIPEIIDGERKSENMNEEVKETVLKLSDYTETINQNAYSARTTHPFQRNGAPFRFRLSKAQQVY